MGRPLLARRAGQRLEVLSSEVSIHRALSRDQAADQAREHGDAEGLIDHQHLARDRRRAVSAEDLPDPKTVREAEELESWKQRENTKKPSHYGTAALPHRIHRNRLGSQNVAAANRPFIFASYLGISTIGIGNTKLETNGRL